MTAIALLGVGVWMAGVASGRPDEKEAKESIEKLIKAMKADPAAAKKLAEEVAKKVDLEDVMNLLKPKAKGGLGFNPKEDPKKDGIELKLLAIAKTPPSKMDLQNQAAEFGRLIDVSSAVIEVASNVAPPKAKTQGKGPKDWKQNTEDAKKGLKELGDAVKSAEPAKVKTAANNLNNSCNNCHTDFR
jgi:hypothetical protein